MNNFVKSARRSIILAVLFLPYLVFAALNQGVDAKLNPLGSVSSLWELLSKALQVLIQIGVPVAALALVYSGYLFVTAVGDEKQLGSAKETFKWVVVGIAIMLGAQAIVVTVQQTIGSLGN